ncbi:MAG TPA: MDR family MFS transporter [Candidatus Limnocylindrales bacterium]|nr:MDR family MFS transporter [Candidatus Limnocylindrales bacterium]
MIPASLSRWLASQPPGYTMTIRRLLAIYAGLMLVVFIAMADQTIVATGLPHIVADVGGLAEYSWIFSSYMLASTVTVPVWGKLSDVFGKRLLLLWGIGIFVVGSVLCGLARSMPELIAFRALQGVGAGGLSPLAMATIGAIVPLRDRGRFQGLIVAAFSSGAGVGPLVGGFIVDRYHWGWIFFVNVPVGIVAAAVIAFTMRAPRARVRRRVDWEGALALAGASTLFILGLLDGGKSAPWTSPQIVLELGGAVVLVVLFVVLERRASEPILPFEALRRKTVAASVACYALGGMLTLGVITYVPLFVQGVIRASATASGLVLWPQMLAGSLASFVVGHWIARTGRLRPTAVVGPVVMTLGMLSLWRMNGSTTAATVARDTALVGLGWGMMAQVFILSVQNAVPRSLVGSATALMVFSRQLGAALGVAAMGAVVNSRLPGGTRLDPTKLGTSATDGLTGSVLAHAITPVFLAAAGVAALVFPIALWGVEQVNLRRVVEIETPATEITTQPAP